MQDVSNFIDYQEALKFGLSVHAGNAVIAWMSSKSGVLADFAGGGEGD